jgi:hypothetical protein
VASYTDDLVPETYKIRDVAHVRENHPWVLAILSLPKNYYREQPKNMSLIYIAISSLAEKGLLNKPGFEYTDDEIKKEVLIQYNLYDLYATNIDTFFVNIDPGFRNPNPMSRPESIRLYPGEQKLLVHVDTKLNNLAVVGGKAYAYNAGVQVTEWTSETAYWSVQYLINKKRHRLNKCQQFLNYGTNIKTLLTNALKIFFTSSRM